ncbi:MAG TPA: 30S ribosomal protein S2 [Rubrobacteraceae bacterium]|nr:30S ribosomal protein S2 [Rubrobacteraceae bacterium]
MQSSVEQDIGVRELLEAGVHFGHQARRWNPKMRKYVFAERTGVHIIDLDQTLELLDRARQFAREVAEAGREILFVGTKKQAQYTVAEQAIRAGQPYVVERYIGGMLTNFQTIYPRIQYFKGLARDVEETPEEARTGREWYAKEREYQKLRRNFAGITEMERLPVAVFVVDPKKEELLVKEANRLKIPVIALTDTNCDPDVVDYVIPGNDDAIRSINLISGLIAGAILEGRGDEGASLSYDRSRPRRSRRRKSSKRWPPQRASLRLPKRVASRMMIRKVWRTPRSLPARSRRRRIRRRAIRICSIARNAGASA